MQHLTIARTWDGLTLGQEERVELTLETTGDSLRVVVNAPFHGDPAPAGPPGPTPGLWNHEVVELFVVGAALAGPPYTELELSPHGHHLLLRLSGVRKVIEQGLPLAYRASITSRRWQGDALVPRRLLPPPPHRLNAFAIHGAGPERRYLAMTPVPGAAPDFHRLEYFLPWDLP